MSQTLIDIQGKYWMRAVVRVRQSNIDYDAVVLAVSPTPRRRVRCERVLVRPVEKPNVVPKWCAADELEVMQYGGVESSAPAGIRI
jgi:hypothetical protein